MKRIALYFLISVGFISQANALTSFDKAVWIPYWQKTAGASTTLQNLDAVTQISPFAFELQSSGEIKDVMKIDEEPWLSLIAEAKNKKIKIYPSILSYAQTDKEKNLLWLLLAQKKRRDAHIRDIVSLVTTNGFDGIDIDYENKVASIKPYFSVFLQDLSKALHKKGKKLICTVEARTPPESRYATTSKVILARVEYSNDYKIIGNACDQIRLMAYDQAEDDAQLMFANRDVGNLYRPVADIEWVKKILTLALRDIPAKKLVLGVATYGNKYEILPAVGTTTTKYIRVGSMNFNYADDLAKSLNIIPTRNNAGELSFTYATSTGIQNQALGAYKQYLVWYSDSVAIADKIRIAKLYKLGGVSVFKIDGGNDPKVWEVLRAQ